jgi:hypothetical protein
MRLNAFPQSVIRRNAIATGQQFGGPVPCRAPHSSQQKMLFGAPDYAALLSWETANPPAEFLLVDHNGVLPYTIFDVVLSTVMANAWYPWGMQLQVGVGFTAANVANLLVGGVLIWRERYRNLYPRVASINAFDDSAGNAWIQMPWGVLGACDLAWDNGPWSCQPQQPGVDNPYIVGIIGPKRVAFAVGDAYPPSYYYPPPPYPRYPAQ